MAITIPGLSMTILRPMTSFLLTGGSEKILRVENTISITSLRLQAGAHRREMCNSQCDLYHKGGSGGDRRRAGSTSLTTKLEQRLGSLRGIARVRAREMGKPTIKSLVAGRGTYWKH